MPSSSHLGKLIPVSVKWKFGGRASLAVFNNSEKPGYFKASARSVLQLLAIR